MSMIECPQCGVPIMFNHDGEFDDEDVLCAACAAAEEIEITETHFECPECDHTTVLPGDVVETIENRVNCEECGFLFPLDDEEYEDA